MASAGEGRAGFREAGTQLKLFAFAHNVYPCYAPVWLIMSFGAIRCLVFVQTMEG